MGCRVAVVRTDVSQERMASIRLERICELGTSSLTPFTQIMGAMSSSETSARERVTRHHIQEDGILQIHSDL
jgi:hypothetical protein